MNFFEVILRGHEIFEGFWKIPSSPGWSILYDTSLNLEESTLLHIINKYWFSLLDHTRFYGVRKLENVTDGTIPYFSKQQPPFHNHDGS